MAKNSQPAYDQAFYAAIIAERRKLGASGGFVDIDECMATMGREYSPNVFQNETVEDERA